MSDFFMSGTADESYMDVRDEITADAASYKATIQSAWDNYSDLINDPNFPSNARTNFWSAAWHLFLLDNLRECGYAMQPTGDAQPDIRVNLDGRTIWIEGVSVMPGEGQNQVGPPEVGVYEPEWDKILLRLTSGLEDKKRAFAKYIQNGVVGEGDACIIALNSVAVPDSGFWQHDMDNEIMTVLFGMGNLLTHMDIETLEPIREEFGFRPTIKKTSTGAEVSNFFFSPPHQTLDISGVIYSPNRPFYRDVPHLKWIHNPHSRRGIEPRVLRLGVENWLVDRKLEMNLWWPSA